MSRLNKVIPILSLPLTIFAGVSSCAGILIPDFYSSETLNWQAQSAGQDIIDLFLIVPVLLVSAFFARRHNKNALLIWAGTVMYLSYTFLIYCFDVHFNRLFIIYCMTLGLSFYSLLYFFYSQMKTLDVMDVKVPALIKTAGIYFLITACLFYFLWLSEIIPAMMDNTIPKSLRDVGLPTNAVHVIDLSLFLPGIFITGILLLKKRQAGFLLAPIMLTFFVLMDITICGLIIIMQRKQVEDNLSAAAMMSVFAVISICLLTWYLKNLKTSLVSARSETEGR
jgi:hypothetical protein